MLLDVLLPLGLLIVVAKLVEGFLGRFGLSSIVAYTATGVILGPVLGIVEPSPEIQLFLGLGIFVLFFLVGLDEIDIQGFVATIRGRYFVAAVLSVIISLGGRHAGHLRSRRLPFALGLHFTEALALAGILSLSSLGLVAKVLADSGHLKEPIGLKIFTIVAIAEVAALLVVGFTIGEHHEPSLMGMVTLLLQIFGFVVVTWVLSTRVLPPAILFLQRFLNVPELSFGLLLGGLFLIVVGAEKIGLHGTIGALLFGVRCPACRNASTGRSCRACAVRRRVCSCRCSSPRPACSSTSPSPPCRSPRSPRCGDTAGGQVRGGVPQHLPDPHRGAVHARHGLMSKGVAEIALPPGSARVRGHRTRRVLAVRAHHVRLHPVHAADPRLRDQANAPDQHRGAAAVGAALLRPRSARRRQGEFRSRPHPRYPGPDVTVESFAADWVVPKERDYVVIEGGKVAGIVSLSKIRSIAKDKRGPPPWRRCCGPRSRRHGRTN